jgi:DNA (cytosine-5)-methyltransferase 1
MNTPIEAVDQFAGMGGTSTGLYDACDELGLKPNLTAINHSKLALESHKANHPDARHIPERLEALRPIEVIPGGYLDIMVSSPECTYHSNAAGGVPVNDQSRQTAFRVLDWAADLYIDRILIENVPEFRNWGPLDKDRKRIKKLKGKTYLSFLDQLRSLDYIVDERIVTCADYGDATTRQRLFIMARRGGKPVVWPDPTHAKQGAVDLFGLDRQPWRPAREIIDWTVKGQSIFKRKIPLKPNTIRRILKGLQKYSGLPFVLGQQSAAAPRLTDDPLPTVAGAGAISFIEPFLLKFYGTNDAAPVDEPLPTVTANGQHLGLCEPFLVEYHGSSYPGGERVRSVNEPMPAVATNNQFALCEPVLVTVNHGKDDSRTYSLEGPMPTITSVDAWGVAQPFLISYYGTGQAESIEEPLDTVTTKDRFGLVIPLVNGYAVVDILFRMLQPHELAAAHSLPDYVIKGNREEKVKQIGNSVPRRTAKALCYSLLADLPKGVLQ